ncbi:MAG: MoxR family ATPase [Cyanobacteria bacterium J06581_3]
MPDWKVFQGSHKDSKAKLEQLLSVDAPSWRQFADEAQADSFNAAADKKYWDDLRAIAANKTRDRLRGERFRLRISNPATSGKAGKKGATADNPYAEVIAAVNAALYLRRPLMITGRPGAGKTSLAYALAHELGLGPVLLWPITTRSSLVRDGLYEYDAIARLQDAQLGEQLSKLAAKPGDKEAAVRAAAENIQNIGQYIRLGPVGTAFVRSNTPRVLLIDEIDKSDINLPNELLNLFEEGEFEIPELKRLSKEGSELQSVESEDGLPVMIPQGKVRCKEFPIIIMTSNGERDFPPAFYRRCLRVRMPNPSKNALQEIVKAHLGEQNVEIFSDVIDDFVEEQTSETSKRLPTDSLLNLIYLFAQQPQSTEQSLDKSILRDLLFNSSSQDGGEDDD